MKYLTTFDLTEELFTIQLVLSDKRKAEKFHTGIKKFPK